MNRNLNIALCDDNIHILVHLNQLIKNQLNLINCSYQIYKFNSPYALLRSDKMYDLLFLDIEMPEMDGLTLSRLLAEKYKHSKTIFVTSHQEYVQDGYKVNAYRFLYKPLKEEDVQEVLSSYLKPNCTQNGISLASRNETIYLPLSQIIYLESLGDCTAVHQPTQIFITYKGLSTLLPQLDERFFLCHRSYIVNFDFIASLDLPSHRLYLQNKDTLPVSVRKKKLLKETYFAFMQKNARYL